MRISRPHSLVLPLLALVALVAAACAPAAAPTPTPAPAKPAEVAKPAAPATTAPAKPTEAAKPAAAKPTAAPAASPAAKPAEATKPAASPVASPAAAAKPAEPKPAAAAKPATFDEQAVADFYRGKTVKLLVGFSAGGLVDTFSRTIGEHLSEHIPGNPTVIVENRPGAGSLLVTNQVYSAEPKDGTIVGANTLAVVLQELIGGEGVNFEGARTQWIAAANKGNSTCIVRSDLGVDTIQEAIGKDLVIGTAGTNNETYLAPVILNETLGTGFKLLTGYASLAQARLAFENKEIDGYCPNFDALTAIDAAKFEGPNPAAKVLVVFGDSVPEHPLLRGVPNALDLAKTEEEKQLMRAANISPEYFPAYFMAPEVPADRVAAMRQAFARTLSDPELLAAAKQRNLSISPSSGAEVQQAVQRMLSVRPDVRDQLKEVVTP